MKKCRLSICKCSKAFSGYNGIIILMVRLAFDGVCCVFIRYQCLCVCTLYFLSIISCIVK